MIVLVIGSGGREHAIVRALSADPEVDQIVAVPGNPGMAQLARCVPDAAPTTDPEGMAQLAVDLGVDLVVVGPEAPLVAGVADAVRARGIACFGPSAEAARLEGSKAFAKEVMALAAVPTAMAHICTTVEAVADALEATGAPYVVKDDGLAAGKGVVVTADLEAAMAHGRACLDKPGSSTVVVEEYLDGPEVSLFCVTDGLTVLPLALAQDFKRVGDDDAGPNTGGMGAYSPLPWAPDGLVEEVLARVARPTIGAMRRRGTPFAGVLYVGLALTERGPRVVEFNARLGDPEAQVVLARLRSPLAQLLLAAAEGRLEEVPPLHWQRDPAVAVVLTAPGYPSAPVSGGEITGVEAAGRLLGVHVLHAGTRLDDGRLVASGGRVLTVVAVGSDLAEARQRAYAGLGEIALEGGYHRTDIALRASRSEVGV